MVFPQPLPHRSQKAGSNREALEERSCSLQPSPEFSVATPAHPSLCLSIAKGCQRFFVRGRVLPLTTSIFYVIITYRNCPSVSHREVEDFASNFNSLSFFQFDEILLSLPFLLISSISNNTLKPIISVSNPAQLPRITHREQKPPTSKQSTDFHNFCLCQHGIPIPGSSCPGGHNLKLCSFVLSESSI